jgi:acyl-CoA thioesterase FadM
MAEVDERRKVSGPGAPSMVLSLDPDHARPTIAERRPRFEGSNIGTWIGFKHVMYLAEEGALQFLRDRGVAPGHLFEKHALCVEVVESGLRLLRALHMDDLVRIETRPATKAGDRELSLAIEMFVSRDGRVVKAAGGQVKLVFRQADVRFGGAEPPPETLLPYVTPEIRRGRSKEQPAAVCVGRGSANPDEDPIRRWIPKDSNAFVWKWHVPYFYCHFTERLQHSGYVRILEEVVDRFLADRGISIQTMLRRRGWIPVVTDAKVEILREALMEETLYTVYTVDTIFKRLSYTARMDCYVPRDGSLVPTARGWITHGYLHIADRGTAGALAEFDDTVVAALSGERAG